MFCALQGHYISGERLQDHWSSGYYMLGGNLGSLLYGDVSVMCQNTDHSYTMQSTREIIGFNLPPFNAGQ